nr:alpha-E domain-containing protein [Psychrobacter sp. I-STPA10]
MILLLSTANQLVWLGRYSERLYHYDSLINQLIKNTLSEQQICHLDRCLGFNVNNNVNNNAKQLLTKADLTTALLHTLEEDKIPNVIEAIEANVQEVKGVIGKDTAELYNLIKRLASAGTYRAATLQLHACNAAMKQEHTLVTLFWQLGRHFEQLDRSILLQEDSSEASLNLKYWVNQLPENTRWRELIRLTNQIINSKDIRDYELLNTEFNTILQQGV